MRDVGLQQFPRAARHEIGSVHRRRLAPLLGPSFDEAEIRGFLEGVGARPRHLDEDALLDAVVDLLDQGKVVGWFQGRESPYMLLTAGVRADRMRPLPPSQASARGLEMLLACRSVIPAVTRVDGSARVQTVDEARHGRFCRLMRRFEERTGCPVLLNTSFNVRGEPIVCRPADAWQCFLGTNMDALVLERFLLLREEQPQASEHAVDEYLARFQPD